MTQRQTLGGILKGYAASFLGGLLKGTLREGTLENISGFSNQDYQLGLVDTGISKEKLLKEYKSWVYACVDARAKEVGAAEILVNVKRSQSEFTEAKRNHPLVTLLENPNPFLTRYELLYYTEAHLSLTGNAYWYTPRNRLGVIAEIWPLSPARMVIVPDKKKYISHYILVGVNGDEDIILTPQEICHIRYPNPKTNGVYGFGPLEAAASDVDINNFQKETQRQFYKNWAVPEFALKTDTDLSPLAIRKLRKDWAKLYQGVRNRGTIAILDNGLSIEKIGVDPKNLDWLANNRATMQSICAIFKVPPSKLGQEDVPNRAVAEASNYSFAKNVIDPSLHFITGRMTLDLARDFDEKLFVSFTSTVKDDEERKARVRQLNLASGVRTINEERIAMGDDEVEGGDEILVPSGFTPLSQLLKGQNENENTPPPVGAGDDADSGDGADGSADNGS